MFSKIESFHSRVRNPPRSSGTGKKPSGDCIREAQYYRRDKVSGVAGRGYIPCSRPVSSPCISTTNSSSISGKGIPPRGSISNPSGWHPCALLPHLYVCLDVSGTVPAMLPCLLLPQYARMHACRGPVSHPCCSDAEAFTHPLRVMNDLAHQFLCGRLFSRRQSVEPLVDQFD